MSFGASNQDVLTGREPLRYSTIPGLSNASYIINRKYERNDPGVMRALSTDPSKTGMQNFAKFVRHFTNNPSKDEMSKAVSLLNKGTQGGI